MGADDKTINNSPEECTTWEAPPVSKNRECQPLLNSSNKLGKADQEDQVTHGGKQVQTDKKGLIISIIILLGSIPALIGAWCWPALVIGLLSGTASAASRALGHKISLSVTGSMMVLMNAYMLYCAITKRRGVPYRYVPFCLTFAAAFFVCADLLRHVLVDQDIWHAGPFPGSSQYRPHCKHQNITCLAFTGFLFTIIFTYSGFFLLFWGSMWNANMLTKLKQVKKNGMTYVSKCNVTFVFWNNVQTFSIVQSKQINVFFCIYLNFKFCLFFFF